MEDGKTCQKEAMHLFITTNRLLRKNIENIVSKIGCHHTQHRILIYLTDHQRTPSQREIADFLNISPAAVAVTLKKMEKNGLIEKTTHHDDSRIKQIIITDKGQRIVQATKQIFKATDIAVFEGFSEQDLEHFMNYLKRFQNNITALDIEQIASLGKEIIEFEKMD